MQLGIAIAIFLTLSALLMALFCFVTKYFNYRLKRALEDANEVYSMIDEICQNSEEEIEGQYDEFLKKRSQQKGKRKSPKLNDEDMLIEMSQIKEPLGVNNDIYGLSVLRRRLNGEVIPMKMESNRSISSLKQFQPDKINTTNRSDKLDQNSFQTRKDNLTKYTFTTKLLYYNEKGIDVINVKAISMKMNTQGEIILNKKVKKSTFDSSKQSFEKELEIYGFEEFEYEGYKYTTTVEIKDMKQNENYLIKNLKKSEVKEQILSEAEFKQLETQLEQKLQ